MQYLVPEEGDLQADLAAPKTKKRYCIDYAIVKQLSRRRCMNVTLIQGAECNTDHQMLRLKLRVCPKRMFCRQRGDEMSKSRFDVEVA